MYVFGGHTHSLEDKLNDMWIYNIKSCIWSEVKYDNKNGFGSGGNLFGSGNNMIIPNSRSGHNMVIDQVNNRIIVFGGCSGEKSEYELNDMWQFNIFTLKWDIIH